MNRCRAIVGLAFLLFVAWEAALSGDKKADETPKEETIEAHDSVTKGALQVKSVSGVGDWFMVYQNGKQLAPPGKPKLNNTVELAPGDYTVRVNATERKVTVKEGKKTVLLTGELSVEAKPGTPGWFTPFQGKEAKLATNPPLLNSAIALFAGKYKVVHYEGGVGPRHDLGEVEIKPGRKTVIKR